MPLRLSQTTLFIFFALPFAYHLYSAAEAYFPHRIRLWNALLALVSLVALFFVILQIKNSFAGGDLSHLQLELLHLLPPALALLSIWNGRPLFPSLQRQLSPRLLPDGDTFAPVPLNAEVEKLSWESLVISDDLKEELQSVVTLLKDSRAAKQYGISVPKGILLSGPPGTGKTTIAKVIANVAGLSFFALRADEIVSKWVGESEKNLSRLFEAAKQHAPAVLFIDEVDSLGKKRSDASATHSDNLLNHLLQLIDGVISVEGLFVIAATNRPELVDEALKRPGRLTRTIEIGLPDEVARRSLFELYLAELHLDGDISIDDLVVATDGASPAQIREICNQAGMHAYRRESSRDEKSRSYVITDGDIEAALADFSVTEEEQTSDGEAIAPLNDEVEKVTWDDVIVDKALREELDAVVSLLKDPTIATRYGIEAPKGILLDGPPGTGKTTLAKIIASTAGLSFFVLKMDDIVSKWVGDSEKNLSRLFKAAERYAPSAIFIDEIDSIGKNRAEGNAQHADNLLNHLLQLIDGVVKTEGIYVIGATNRADLVDPALKRGGRLSRVITVPLPDYESRKALFALYLSKLTLDGPTDVAQLAKLTEHFCPADIRAACNQAGLIAFQRESRSGRREFLVRVDDLLKAVRERVRG